MNNKLDVPDKKYQRKRFCKLRVDMQFQHGKYHFSQFFSINFKNSVGLDKS